MSAKWRRSLAWDDRIFPPWAGWAKFVLRAFSSIWLAVFLLVLVALYGVLASVPIGLLALLPTKALYAASLLATIAVVAILPAVILRRTVLRRLPRAGRFAVLLVVLLGLGALAVSLWLEHAWPRLAYDPATGSGFRLFPGFVEAYSTITVRRLPVLEMSELEFYAWWPLRLILLLFVANLVIATVRRIEFRFVNIGVLTVHTGIVTIALGSICYASFKQEGDTLLLAPPPGSAMGPPVASFYDHLEVALRVRQDDRLWEQRPVRGAPRYNDYATPWSDRPLSIDVASRAGFVDEDVQFRIVGFASYADLRHAFRPAEPLPDAAPLNPLVTVELRSALPDPESNPPAPGQAAPPADVRTIARTTLPAADPAHRIAFVEDVLAVEHVPAAHADRWASLVATFPAAADHALRIGLPGAPPEVIGVRPGDTILRSGFRIDVESIEPQPPFPIITPGFEGATSSVATLRVTPPEGEAFQRFVYHRFPEIDQDITGSHEDGRPIRRPADRSIVSIDYIDASIWQVYISALGPAAVRRPGGELAVVESLPLDTPLAIAPFVDLILAERSPHSEEVEEPVDVPEADRDRSLVGTHTRSVVRVEVAGASDPRPVSVWLPFSRYPGAGGASERTVTLADGRRFTLAFTRLERPLPGVAIALVDFEMIPYPHSDAPRDFVSTIRVLDTVRGEERETVTRLNAPLVHRVAFQENPRAPLVANWMAQAISRVIPNQYKFSQAGWDSEGWRRSKQQAEAGLTDRARAQFTILQVGNNPGIYVIAAGGVMMGAGIPWAFYVKPLILRRRKAKIQRELAAQRPADRVAAGPRAEAEPIGVTP